MWQMTCRVTALPLSLQRYPERTPGQHPFPCNISDPVRPTARLGIYMGTYLIRRKGVRYSICGQNYFVLCGLISAATYRQRNTDRETDRQRNIQTETDKDWETYRQRQIKTKRETKKKLSVSCQSAQTANFKFCLSLSLCLVVFTKRQRDKDKNWKTHNKWSCV